MDHPGPGLGSYDSCMSNWSVTQHGGVAKLTFTRPPCNFLDFASIAELGDRLEGLAEQT